MNRRGFLGSILALAAAPAIVRAETLMPVRPLEVIECQVGWYEGVMIYEGNSVRAMARAGLAKWWAEQFDRLTLDYLLAQDKPPLQFNLIERVA